jgi:sulfate adenylyltransferase
VKHQQTISKESLQDLINIENGLFKPLTGFMGIEDYKNVIEHLCLSDGSVFPIPITLPIDESLYQCSSSGDTINLWYEGTPCADLEVESLFRVEKDEIFSVFGTSEIEHPGVAKEYSLSPYRAGGKIHITDPKLYKGSLTAEQVCEHFKIMGWGTIAGFQTRNPIHNAHEHLQRVALELCDGLFINPITGWKKTGDFTEEAVMGAYTRMIRDFYPPNRVFLAGLRTQMRYAGPKEAIFHAIIRRNMGCTHFIIGRDHAGVGNYYSAYAAHDLARNITAKHSLGIELLLLREPYYCTKCGFVVSDKSCAHYEHNRKEISGTIIRDHIRRGEFPPKQLMRKEIAKAILEQDEIFVE